MARGIGSFAEGLIAGYTTVSNVLRDKERLALEKQRQELETRKAEAGLREMEDNEAVKKAVREAGAAGKINTVFSVIGPDGTPVVYADEEQAKQHAAAVEGAKIMPSFQVGGQRYDDRESAQAALQRYDTPAARFQRQANVALSMGAPAMAQGYAQARKAMLDANQGEITQAFNEARASGDVNAALDLMNNNMALGTQSKAVTAPDGSIQVYTLKGGQPIGAPAVYANPDEFWQKNEARLSNLTPGLLEAWIKREGLNIQGRQVASQERATNATVRHTDAVTAQMPAELAIRQQQANAAATSAGASAANAQTARLQLTQPKLYSAPDAKGGLTYLTVPQTYDPKQGWQMGTPQVAPVRGVMYPKNNTGLGLGLGLGAPQPKLGDMTPEQLQQLGVILSGANAARDPNPRKVDPNGNWTQGRTAGGPVTGQ